MLFLIILLTAILILDCLILTLLVLMQLPKKEAGAGLAFGGGATDTLFGAGSGNLLTKATKYAAGVFFGTALILSLILSHRYTESDADFRKAIQEQQAAGQTVQPLPQGTPANAAAPSAPSTNLIVPTTPALTSGTNTPAAPR